ncbi:lipopolysaccharide biosynthesis protein [Acinetobacter radioresistens]|uniref:lipopolysaccharide biosynthesis protein n=1 Tax=Acinetobacter radioresistens TaxID=40216 RepID=UPI0021D3BC66|nr:oligosaccharide flippase family protein [Acinetobacter radioresistens]MCU4384211.1 oligosaccharide flippase family protein [Acinetobacter radioresistens]
MAIKNMFVKNLLKLTSSSVMAQLILIISSPILTRLYNPNDFGLFALFLSVLTILATLANLRYDQAIIIPKDDNKAKQIVYLCLCINIFIFIFIFIILYFFHKNIFSIFNIEELNNLYWILPFAILFIGIFQSFNYWLLRSKEFNQIAKIKIQQSVVIVGFQLVFFRLGALCLILGHTIGQFFGVLVNGFLFLKKNKPNLSGMKQVGHEYRNFPIYSIWSALLNNIGSQLPVFLFTIYFSPAIAGLYLLTQRVIKSPLAIISQAVTQIFISNLRNEDHVIKDRILKINNFLTTIVVVPLAVVMVAGENLFSIIFGSQWKEAGTVAAILVPWIFIVFICSPISSLLEYKGLQKKYLIFQICLFLSRLISIGVGVYLFDEYNHTLLLFSTISTLAWIGFFYFVMKVYYIELSSWLAPILKKICIVFLFFYPLTMLGEINIFIFYLLILLISALSFFIIFEKSILKYED